MEEPLHFTSTLEISTNKLWGAHLPVPAPIAQVFLTEGAKRVVCKLNDTVEFQCALLPKGEGVYCIVVNKKIREQLGLRGGSTARVSLHKDESEYGLPMPDELAEVLAQDEEGNRLFHALTPGKLRTLLYIVGHVKNTDARIARAFVIVEHLKKNAGKINYRQLNEELKGNDE